MVATSADAAFSDMDCAVGATSVYSEISSSRRAKHACVEP